MTVLVSRLTGDMRLHAAVAGIERDGTGYTVRLANGEQIAARAVVLATPAFVSADIVRPLAPGAADLLAGIRYVSTGTISFGFRAAEAPNPLNGYGLVVPASAKRPINAITLSSVKFEQRAPEGYILLRAFFGGSRSPQSMELDDETLIATVRGRAGAVPGHPGRTALSPHLPLAALQPAVRRGPPGAGGRRSRRHCRRGVYVTGSAYRGVGIPDCIKQGQDTAGKIRENQL